MGLEKRSGGIGLFFFDYVSPLGLFFSLLWNIFFLETLNYIMFSTPSSSFRSFSVSFFGLSLLSLEPVSCSLSSLRSFPFCKNFLEQVRGLMDGGGATLRFRERY